MPFYLQWSGEPPKEISLIATGFTSISRLFNTQGVEVGEDKATIESDKIITNGYLGGLLTTKEVDEPFAEAALEVAIRTNTGAGFVKKETRILYSTRVQSIDIPANVSLPIAKGVLPVEVVLCGKSTVFVSINEIEGSSVDLVLPDSVLTAFEKLSQAFIEGIKPLKEKYPQHSEFFEAVLNPQKYRSFKELNEDVSEKTKSLQFDEKLMEDIKLILIASFIGQVSVREALLLPLYEYFQSTADTKVFLESPYLCASIPKGKSTLICNLELVDLHRRRNGQTSRIEVKFSNGDEPLILPLKELIKIRRS